MPENTTPDLSHVHPDSLELVTAILAFGQGKPVRYLKPSTRTWAIVAKPKFNPARQYQAVPDAPTHEENEAD